MTAEPTDSAPTTERIERASPEPVPLQVRLQILSTEHWSLLASRALAWNESFTRASMFLSTLSFATVALALVGQATGFDEEFRIFALVVLPVVLFLGFATSLRMDSANHHDTQCVIGMNRIRAAYMEIAPELDRYFVMGTSDDYDGIVRTMAVMPNRSTLLNLASASPTLIAVLNCVLVAVIAALAAIQVGAVMGSALVVGAIAFAVAVAFWLWATRNILTHLISEYRPHFPAKEPIKGD
jgi:hypothetical protein